MICDGCRFGYSNQTAHIDGCLAPIIPHFIFTNEDSNKFCLTIVTDTGVESKRIEYDENTKYAYLKAIVHATKDAEQCYLTVDSKNVYNILSGKYIHTKIPFYTYYLALKPKIYLLQLKQK